MWYEAIYEQRYEVNYSEVKSSVVTKAVEFGVMCKSVLFNQCSAVQYSAMQYGLVQSRHYSGVKQWFTVQWGVLKYRTVQHWQWWWYLSYLRQRLKKLPESLNHEIALITNSDCHNIIIPNYFKHIFFYDSLRRQQNYLYLFSQCFAKFQNEPMVTAK